MISATAVERRAAWRPRVPAWAAVGSRRWAVPVGALLCSRALVLAAGLVGSSRPRANGWQLFDPTLSSSRLGSLGNALAAPAVRWDSIWYLAIAQHGYRGPGSAVFFPLYPLLIRTLATVTISPLIAAELISLGSFTVALLLLHRLTELELGRRAADATVVLLAFAPLSFFFSAVYTESLFLALAVGCAYAARRERWALAGMLGGLAAATRVTGILLVVLMLPAAQSPRQWLTEVRRRCPWLLMVPAGLSAFLGSMWLAGFGPLAPLGGQARGHLHQFAGPIAAVVRALGAAFHGASALAHGTQPLLDVHGLGSPLSGAGQNVYLLGVLLLATAALGLCLKRLPLRYGCFALLSLLVVLSSPVVGEPLKSLDRYTLTIFPLWMAVGAWLSERRLLAPVAIAGAILLLFFTVEFASWTFVA